MAAGFVDVKATAVEDAPSPGVELLAHAARRIRGAIPTNNVRAVMDGGTISVLAARDPKT